MTSLLWILIAIQIAMGVFDTFYHHEFTERLAWRPSQRYELRLHGARNMLYALLFLVLGWLEVHGAWAWIVIAVLVGGDRHHADGFRRRGYEPEIAGQRAHQSRFARTQLRRHSDAAAAGLERLGDAADGHLISLFRISQSCCRRSGGRRRAVRLAGLRRVTSSCPLDQRAGARPRGGIAGATDGADHRSHRLHRQPADGEPDRCGAPGHRAGPQPGQVRRAGAADHADHEPRPARRRQSDRCIVNLAGEPIGNGLWTEAKRREIVESRTKTTGDLVRLIARLEHKPAVLVSGSAIGWYGLWQDQVLTNRPSRMPASAMTCARPGKTRRVRRPSMG